MATNLGIYTHLVLCDPASEFPAVSNMDNSYDGIIKFKYDRSSDYKP